MRFKSLHYDEEGQCQLVVIGCCENPEHCTENRTHIGPEVSIPVTIPLPQTEEDPQYSTIAETCPCAADWCVYGEAGKPEAE